MRSLEGLTIVLMGASGGMGTACALRLAKPGKRRARTGRAQNGGGTAA